jgi:hypothetical protein
MLHVDHGDQWPKNRIDQWAMKYIAVWSHMIHFLAVINPCSYGGWLQTPAPVGRSVFLKKILYYSHDFQGFISFIGGFIMVYPTTPMIFISFIGIPRVL